MIYDESLNATLRMLDGGIVTKAELALAPTLRNVPFAMWTRNVIEADIHGSKRTGLQTVSYQLSICD